MSMSVKTINGQIRLITGLHIGAGNDEVHIGGVDSEVVRDPLTSLPYIPGSSLKGKMRSLLELSDGLVGEKGKVSNIIDNPDSLVPMLFGDMNSSEITRLLFRDAKISDISIKKINDLNILPTEEKHENSIDRKSGISTPRNIERAISGLVFDFEIVLRLFDNDDEKSFKSVLKRGMHLLELDALGGHGSRGYGKIKFENVKYDGADFDVEEDQN